MIGQVILHIGHVRFHHVELDKGSSQGKSLRVSFFSGLEKAKNIYIYCILII